MRSVHRHLQCFGVTFAAPLALALALAACGSSDPSALGAPAPASRVELFPGGAPAGSAVNGVAILRQDLAVALINNFGVDSQNLLRVFHPRTGAVDAPLALPTVLLPGGLDDSQGSPAPATTPANFPGDAALAAGKVFVSAGNFDFTTFAQQAGAVIVYDLVGGRPALPGRAIVLTNAQGQALFNPAQVLPFVDAQGNERLAVVACGAFFAARLEAQVVIVDPATESIVQRIPVGASATSSLPLASGARALATDRTLYLGSAVESQLFEVDLDQGTASGPIDVTTTVTTDPQNFIFNNVSAVALSHDEATLFAVSSNNASVSVFDRALLQETAILTGFARTKLDRTLRNFENIVQGVVVRPGRPGVDFTGPELLVATINLDDPTDQASPDVRSAIDAVERGSQGQLTLTLNAVPAPFTTAAAGSSNNSGDLQQLAQHAAFPKTLFALEGGTGVLHALPLGQ